LKTAKGGAPADVLKSTANGFISAYDRVDNWVNHDSNSAHELIPQFTVNSKGANATAFAIGLVNPVGGEESDAVKATEIVERAMSSAELKATEETGLIRGGREGTHFVSDAVNSDARRAQQRLALPQKPEVKATMEVPKGKFSAPEKVQPANNMPGGGTERTATGPIPATIKKVEKF